jgi:hypothetical protein
MRLRNLIRAFERSPSAEIERWIVGEALNVLAHTDVLREQLPPPKPADAPDQTKSPKPGTGKPSTTEVAAALAEYYGNAKLQNLLRSAGSTSAEDDRKLHGLALPFADVAAHEKDAFQDFASRRFVDAPRHTSEATRSALRRRYAIDPLSHSTAIEVDEISADWPILSKDSVNFASPTLLDDELAGSSVLPAPSTFDQS